MTIFQAYRPQTTFLIAFFLYLAVCPWPATAQEDDGSSQLGVTVQLPTLGVSIDTSGILSTKVFHDPTGEILNDRLGKLRQRLPKDLQRRSDCRKVSLTKLQHACERAIRESGAPTPVMQQLAGLTKIDYVFLLPDENDIVIAGPAEPWVENTAGRNIGIYSANPVLSLSDLAVSIRAFSPSGEVDNWVACSIDPTPVGIQRLNMVNRNLPKQIGASQEDAAASLFRDQMIEALGLADVKCYGIDSRTHAAQVLVEADYRMKLMAVGLEDPVLRKLTTFAAALKGPPKNLQRWWLTPEYKRLRQSADGLSVQFVGRGIRLGTESVLFDRHANVQRQKTKPSRAARIYSNSFTKNFDALASVKPVFAQLRNVVDCLVAAAWIRKQDGWRKCNLKPELYLEEAKLTTKSNQAIEHAQCVANAIWKRNVLLLIAGGGVSISAMEALSKENLKLEEGKKLQELARTIDIDEAAWWWD